MISREEAQKECIRRSILQWDLAQERKAQARSLPFWRIRDKRLLNSEAGRLEDSSWKLLVAAA